MANIQVFRYASIDCKKTSEDCLSCFCAFIHCGLLEWFPINLCSKVFLKFLLRWIRRQLKLSPIDKAKSGMIWFTELKLDAYVIFQCDHGFIGTMCFERRPPHHDALCSVADQAESGLILEQHVSQALGGGVGVGVGGGGGEQNMEWPLLPFVFLSWTSYSQRPPLWLESAHGQTPASNLLQSWTVPIVRTFNPPSYSLFRKEVFKSWRLTLKWLDSKSCQNVLRSCGKFLSEKVLSTGWKMNHWEGSSDTFQTELTPVVCFLGEGVVDSTWGVTRTTPFLLRRFSFALLTLLRWALEVLSGATPDTNH